MTRATSSTHIYLYLSSIINIIGTVSRTVIIIIMSRGSFPSLRRRLSRQPHTMPRAKNPNPTRVRVAGVDVDPPSSARRPDVAPRGEKRAAANDASRAKKRVAASPRDGLINFAIDDENDDGVALGSAVATRIGAASVTNASASTVVAVVRASRRTRGETRDGTATATTSARGDFVGGEVEVDAAPSTPDAMSLRFKCENDAVYRVDGVNAEAFRVVMRSGMATARLTKDGAEGGRLTVKMKPVAFEACSEVQTAGGYVTKGIAKVFKALAVVYAGLCDDGIDGEAPGRFDGGLDLAGIFEAVKPNENACPEADRDYYALLPTPRSYQKQAVGWMLARERAKDAPAGALSAKRGGDVDKTELHPLWRELPEGGGYINPYSGHLTKTRFECDFESVSGGILADEMGLGKTVEVIMLVLANREPRRAQSRSQFVPPPMTDDMKEEIDDVVLIKDDEAPVKVCCPCGARHDDPFYDGLWIECEKCETWMHARCVGLAQSRNQEIKLMKMSEEERGRKLKDFTCGKCIAAHASETVDETCGATLVVCPSAIIKQWRDECNQHVRPGTLKIITYEGQSKRSGAGGSMKGVFSAKELADADIVLTTYDTLRTEIDIDTANGHGLAGAERARRYEKKYEVVPTPLTRLKWWRVVLDEAQMVESTVSKAAEMVRRLPTVHRWAVTGTPISRGLGDIFGLLTFLMVSPFQHGDFWWRRMIEIPYMSGDVSARELLHKILKGLMWRNSRADMERQLGIPPQGEVATWLRSSAVEQHWYSRQYANCAADANATLRRFIRHADSESLPPNKASSVMGPLLRLRQACDHPQAGSHGLAGGIRAGANVLTMEQISEKLVERARIEAEEAQRLVAFSLNALAGIAWILGTFDIVIETYREVLKLEGEGKQRGIRMDTLQRLHALHNLNLAMREVKANKELLKGKIIAPTIRDDDLEKEANLERAAYMAQRAGGVPAATRELEVTSANVAKHLAFGSIARVDKFTWWLFILDHAMTSEGTAEDVAASNILARVLEALDGRWQDKQAPFRSTDGLKMTMANDLEEIHNTRARVMESVSEIRVRVENPSEDDVRTIGSCSNCRKDTDFALPGVVCMFCKAEPLLSEFEAKIFGVRNLRLQQNRTNDDDSQNRETFVPRVSRYGRKYEREETNRGGASSVEAVLRILVPMVHSLSAPSSYVEESAAHVAALEEMRKEFYKISQLIVQQREEVASRDELDMAVARIRTRHDHELPPHGFHRFTGWLMQNDPVPEGLRGSVIYRDEVEGLSVNYTTQKLVYEKDLRKAMSQLKYLEDNLRAENAGGENTIATDCPVCMVSFAGTNAEICVFPCGHRTCVSCALDLVRREHGERVSCVTCRVRAYVEELMYVNNVDNRTGVRDAADYVRRGKGGDVRFLTDLLGVEADLLGGEQQVLVSGSWGTKIEAIIRRLRYLLLREDDAKMIVFSEWDDVLDVVEKAMRANEIRFVRGVSGPKFRDVIDTFKHDAACNVLLLPLKRGAHGLNLTEAQHVLLLEPVLDPGMEAQAIKRVDRIGQTRPTCVHRFFIRDTIEENVHNFSRQRADAMSDIASDVALQKKGKDAGLTLGELRALLERPDGRARRALDARRRDGDGDDVDREVIELE